MRALCLLPKKAREEKLFRSWKRSMTFYHSNNNFSPNRCSTLGFRAKVTKTKLCRKNFTISNLKFNTMATFKFILSKLDYQKKRKVLNPF